LSSKNGQVSQADVNHTIVALKKAGMHEIAGLVSDLWDMAESRPEDVKRCWHDMARRAQAACSGNDGLGIVTIRAGVFGNEAIAWKATIESYDMMAERTTEISPETMGTLLALVEDEKND
jgi:hypothetical protein